MFLTAREGVKEFRRRGKKDGQRRLGHVICISSVHEIVPWAGHVNYAASKGGAMLFMKSLAQEVAEEGIRVNGIAPGAIATPINQEAWETPEAEKELNTLIPQGRVGVPDDIGEDIDGERQVLVEDFDVVAGVFLGGKGVELPADGIDSLSNIFRGPRRRAFEQHVLDKVGDPTTLGRFVPGSTRQPHADADGTDLRHPLREDAKAVVENISNDR
jgi:hypothetical protein